MAKKVEKRELDDLISEVRKEFGDGAIFYGHADAGKRLDIETVSTGSLKIDQILGVGGLPKGRIVEIFGAEASGKTTLTLHVIANAQKKGWRCAFIDAEHALDPIYAKRIGVDVNELLISQPDNGEQALEIYRKLCKSDIVDVIVVDSVAALVPLKELEGEVGDSSMGLQARMMSQFCRMAASETKKHNVLGIMINQTRSKIGVMFGSPETTTGGNALKFYASARLKVYSSDKQVEGDRVVGNLMNVKVVKNKLAPPHTEGAVRITFGKGFDSVAELIALGIDFGLVDKAGAWFSYKGERIGQGAAAAHATITTNKSMQEQLRKEVVAKLDEQSKGGIVAEEVTDTSKDDYDAADAEHTEVEEEAEEKKESNKKKKA